MSYSSQFSRPLLLAASLVLLTTGFISAQGPGQRPPSPVVVAEVVKRPVITGQTFIGTVTPVKTASVGSAVDGRIADFPVNEGDFVEKGQPLAQLLTATITLEHEAAVHELSLREEELKELENGSRPEEVRRAQAAMAAAKASREYHQKKRDRADELYARNAINNDELQLVVAEQIQAEQEYLQAVEAYELIVAGPRQEQIAQARAQVAIRRAIANRLADQIEKHTIRAPFDGFISAEHTELGQWVNRGELVADVLALGEVDIESYVPEQYITYIHKGQQVSVEIPALPDQLFTGIVEVVIPQADTRSRTFPVKIRVTNQINDNEPLIKSGMMARVYLPTGNRQETLLVPKDAVVLGGPQKMVYAITPGEKDKPASVRPVPVQIGVADGTLLQVSGELNPGDQVVVRGNERLRPGQPVAVSEVLPTPSASSEGATSANSAAEELNAEQPNAGQ